MSRPIYLDCHATTPVDERVLAAMLPYFTEHFGNPSSVGHCYGMQAEAGVKKARKIIAEAINCAPEEIFFTSGATEANNLAIKGVAEANFTKGRHIITVQTEHKAVLEPCKYLQALGFEVTFLCVKPDGLIDVEDLIKHIRHDTILVSVMMANNEIGVIQPLEQIGNICGERGVLLHSDGAQAIAKIPIDVQKMNISLLSMTAHKIYGPKGVGALYIRRRPKVAIAPLLHGGSQEQMIRPGTLSPPLIVGLAKAVALGMEEMSTEGQRQLHLRQQLWQWLSQLTGVHLNGDINLRLPGNLNISFEGVDGAALLLALRQVAAVSSGSACSSASTSPSHVLTAIGRSDALANASLRFGLGRFTTAEDIDIVAKEVTATVTSMRQVSSRSQENLIMGLR